MMPYIVVDRHPGLFSLNCSSTMLAPIFKIDRELEMRKVETFVPLGWMIQGVIYSIKQDYIRDRYLK